MHRLAEVHALPPEPVPVSAARVHSDGREKTCPLVLAPADSTLDSERRTRPGRVGAWLSRETAAPWPG